MLLKDRIQADLISSLKEKRELELSVLRMLQAAILNKEKEKRYKLSKEKSEVLGNDLEQASQLSDEEIIDVIFGEVKKRKEAQLLFEKGGRVDLAEKEKREIEILNQYLPEQISEEELRILIKEAILKTGAKDKKDIGKVMTQLMPKVKGRAAGNEVSRIVRELLEIQ
jgi:hypothetical protein